MWLQRRRQTDGSRTQQGLYKQKATYAVREKPRDRSKCSMQVVVVCCRYAAFTTILPQLTLVSLQSAQLLEFGLLMQIPKVKSVMIKLSRARQPDRTTGHIHDSIHASLLLPSARLLCLQRCKLPKHLPHFDVPVGKHMASRKRQSSCGQGAQSS